MHYIIIYLDTCVVEILSTEQFNHYTKCDTDKVLYCGQGTADLAPTVVVVMVLLGLGSTGDADPAAQ